MKEPERFHVHIDADGTQHAYVVELAPYRERRRVRRVAFGMLLGYLAGAWLLPAAAELAEAWLAADQLARENGHHVDERVAAYTEPPPA